MASDEENAVSGSRSKRRRRRFSDLFSCFGGSPVPDSGEAERDGRPLRRGSSWLSRSRLRLRWMKRTVPVEISGEATTPCVEKSASDELEKKKKKKKGSKKRNSVFEKFGKEMSSKGGGHTTKPHHNQLQKQHHPTPPQPSPRATASKCTAGKDPSPLYQMLDPAKVGDRTRTSHPGSPTAAHSSKELSNCRSRNHLYNDPFMGLSVLTVALSVMLLAGKPCAIFFMCAWFYLSPRLRPERADARNHKVKEVGSEVMDNIIDMDSDEYKKMVVLKGFLERDKRRTTLHA